MLESAGLSPFDEEDPFNPLTTLSFALPRSSYVRLSIFDLAGRHVRTGVDETRSPGRHTVIWEGVDGEGRAVASGVYLYRMEAGSFVRTRRMVLSR